MTTYEINRCFSKQLIHIKLHKFNLFRYRGEKHILFTRLRSNRYRYDNEQRFNNNKIVENK